MKLKNLIIAIMLCSIAVIAGPLNKEIVQRALEASKPLNGLAKKYPEISKQKANPKLFTQEGKNMVSDIKRVNAYDDVNAVVKKHGFANVEDYAKTFSRIMTAVFAAQKDQMQGMNKEVMLQQIESQKAMMKANGMTQEMIDKSMAGMQEALAGMDMIEVSAKEAKPEDVLFVKENIQWIMGLMQSIDPRQ